MDLSSPTRGPASPSGAAANPVPLVVDENPDVFNDADSAISRGGESDTTSLRSSIMKYREENGRTYHSYKDSAYPLPNDDIEGERLDHQHHMFLLAFDGKLNIAPLDKEPQRVLDAGTGTGSWAMDFGDEHPGSHVTGVDLSPMQPGFVPPNVTFYVDDVEDEWTYSHKFDFIFSRMLTGAVKDWPKFFKQAYDNLNPGGVIELQDIIYPISCDDGTLPDNAPLKVCFEMLKEGFARMGAPADTALKYPEQLKDAGFVDIVERWERWPSNWWPKDSKYKQLGAWTYENLMGGLPGLSLAVFTRPKEEGGHGWSREELEVLLAGARKDLKNTAIHAYWPIRAVYARKPE